MEGGIGSGKPLDIEGSGLGSGIINRSSDIVVPVIRRRVVPRAAGGFLNRRGVHSRTVGFVALVFHEVGVAVVLIVRRRAVQRCQFRVVVGAHAVFQAPPVRQTDAARIRIDQGEILARNSLIRGNRYGRGKLALGFPGVLLVIGGAAVGHQTVDVRPDIIITGGGQRQGIGLGARSRPGDGIAAPLNKLGEGAVKEGADIKHAGLLAGVGYGPLDLLLLLDNGTTRGQRLGKRSQQDREGRRQVFPVGVRFDHGADEKRNRLTAFGISSGGIVQRRRGKGYVKGRVIWSIALYPEFQFEENAVAVGIGKRASRGGVDHGPAQEDLSRSLVAPPDRFRNVWRHPGIGESRENRGGDAFGKTGGIDDWWFQVCGIVIDGKCRPGDIVDIVYDNVEIKITSPVEFQLFGGAEDSAAVGNQVQGGGCGPCRRQQSEKQRRHNHKARQK